MLQITFQQNKAVLLVTLNLLEKLLSTFCDFYSLLFFMFIFQSVIWLQKLKKIKKSHFSYDKRKNNKKIQECIKICVFYLT